MYANYMLTNANILTHKNIFKYFCELCDYKTSKKNDYERHKITAKHLNANKMLKTLCEKAEKYGKTLNQNTCVESKLIKKEQNEQNDLEYIYICLCEKTFKHKSSFSRHKKNCNNLFEKNKELQKKDENFFEIIKQNQEFKELIMEQNKIIMDFSKNYNVINNTNNTNCNNKTFNLQVFLNEKCKDALNISDFVNSLKLTLEDLENVGDKGFVDGISRIFVNGLKQLDVYKRPIHCSDLKRETMYLKNENVWEKDNDNKENMKKVIKQIANKNIKNIYEWKDKYPDCKYSDSKKNDQYSRIIIESMGAKTIEEDQVLYEKIIKNIAKETIIDKRK